MRGTSTAFNSRDNVFVKLKDDKWLEKQRIAGKVAAGALCLLQQLVKEKSSLSLLEMSEQAEKYIVDNGCSPTFKGYKGNSNNAFPAAACISVNNQLVHGVPTDYKLQEGDLVSFDLGATYEGAIGDTAITCIYGETKSQEHTRLVEATKEALKKGIEAAKVGNRIGDIGYAIFRSAKGNGYNVIETYGGHGICTSEKNEGIPHTQPFVSNKSTPNEGIRIQPGMTIAIEPLLTRGTTDTWVDKDGWTVNCRGGLCAHEEHTIFIHADHTEIITRRPNE